MENNTLIEKLRARRYASTFIVLATLIVGILIGTVVSKGVKGKTNDSSDASPMALQSSTPQQLSNAFATIAKRLSPSVVNINTDTTLKATGRRGRGNQDFQDFFDRFFGGQGGPGGPDNGDSQGPMGQVQPQREQALGSGVIVDKSGYIVTNFHVVDKADRIRVALNNDPGVLYDAKVVGSDKDTDIAVIKIDPKGKDLVPAKFGDSDTAQVGDWVLAIGSPFGLQATVTAGIVSYKGRAAPGGPQTQFQQFIQTDAAINPGNSGGPLVDMNGNVIGINTAILTESMGYMGIGFAMPSKIVNNVYNQLISPEHRVVRGSIGVTFNSAVKPEVARMFGKGITITEVTPGSPAEQAGLKPEDTITAVNGKAVTTGNELVDLISALKPGSKAEVDYVRDGKPSKASVTIEDRSKLIKDDTADNGEGNGNSTEPQTGKLGVTIRAIPAEMAQRLNIPSGRGVMVVDVKPGSVAEDMQLQRGVVILDLNRKPVTSEQDFRDRVNALKSGDDIVMLVRYPGRGGGQVLLSGTMP